ncbi:MAG: amidohydrolase family protein [Kiritimatiellia bacterium]
MIFDAHQHFWRYTRDEFGWIDDPALRCDFQPADLAATIRAAGVDKVISVEARQSVAETEQLLAYAEECDFIAGVTGWLPIAADDFAAHLERFAARPKLKALRHVIQDEPDDAFILRADFNRGIALLEKTSLAYEILVFQRQMTHAIAFADRHPDLRLVLDHMGKPVKSEKPDREWVRLIREMAKRANVWCKVSGLVTEVGRVDFRPYLEIVLDAFGPRRVMWGSDWPVCTACLSYGAWLEACRAVLSDCCFAEVAEEFYRLKT